MLIFNRRCTFLFMMSFTYLYMSFNIYASRTKGLENTQDGDDKRWKIRHNLLKRTLEQDKNESKQSETKRPKVEKDLLHYVQKLSLYIKTLKNVDPQSHRQWQSKIPVTSPSPDFDTYEDLANLYNKVAMHSYFKDKSALIYKDEAQLRELKVFHFKDRVTRNDYMNIGNAHWNAINNHEAEDDSTDHTANGDDVRKYELYARSYEQAACAYEKSIACLKQTIDKTKEPEEYLKELTKNYKRTVEAYSCAALNYKRSDHFKAAMIYYLKAIDFYEQQLKISQQTMGEDESEIFGNLYRKLFSSALRAEDTRALEWGQKAADFYQSWITLSGESASPYHYDLLADIFVKLANHSNSSSYFHQAAISYEHSLNRSGSQTAIQSHKNWSDIAYIYRQAAKSAISSSDTYAYSKCAIFAYERFLQENSQDDVNIFQNLRSTYFFVAENCLLLEENSPLLEENVNTTIRIKILGRLAQLHTRFYILPHLITNSRPATQLKAEYERTILLYQQLHNEAVLLKDKIIAQSFADEKKCIEKLMRDHFNLP